MSESKPNLPPPLGSPSSSGITPVHGLGLENDLLLRALRREKVSGRPIWFMRQAGRCLPAYRELAKEHGFDKLTRTPELAAKVTLLPLEVLDVDAAIIFSDILTPLQAMGVKVEYGGGKGPQLESGFDVKRAAALEPPEPDSSLAFVGEAISIVKHHLAGSRPLLGFSGAPFTLASYLIEGGGSRDLRLTKKWMYEDQGSFTALLDLLAETAARSLAAQVHAGCHAVQIFDTQAGHLAPRAYRRIVEPATAMTISKLRDLLGTARSVPVVLYLNGCGPHLRSMAESGADALSVDWRTPLGDVRKAVGSHLTLQGNLDPAALYGPVGDVDRMARAVLRDLDDGDPTGHVFNLGHGVLPETPVESLQAAIAAVRDEDKRTADRG